MRAVHLFRLIITATGWATLLVHDFLGGDFFGFALSAFVPSLLAGEEVVSDPDEDEEGEEESLLAALLYPSLR